MKTIFNIGFLLDCFFIFLINPIFVFAEEGQQDELNVIVEIKDSDEKIVEVEDATEPVGSDFNNDNTIDNGRSIKMIVGGQSKEGVAKEVILPVKE